MLRLLAALPAVLGVVAYDGDGTVLMQNAIRTSHGAEGHDKDKVHYQPQRNRKLAQEHTLAQETGAHHKHKKTSHNATHHKHAQHHKHRNDHESKKGDMGNDSEPAHDAQAKLGAVHRVQDLLRQKVGNRLKHKRHEPEPKRVVHEAHVIREGPLSSLIIDEEPPQRPHKAVAIDEKPYLVASPDDHKGRSSKTNTHKAKQVAIDEMPYLASSSEDWPWSKTRGRKSNVHKAWEASEAPVQDTAQAAPVPAEEEEPLPKITESDFADLKAVVTDTSDNSGSRSTPSPVELPPSSEPGPDAAEPASAEVASADPVGPEPSTSEPDSAEPDSAEPASAEPETPPEGPRRTSEDFERDLQPLAKLLEEANVSESLIKELERQLMPAHEVTAAPEAPAAASEDATPAVEEAEPAAASENVSTAVEEATAAPEEPATASEDASPSAEEATATPAEPAAASEDASPAVEEATAAPAEPATVSEDASPSVDEATATPAEPAAASEDTSPAVDEETAAPAAPAAASDTAPGITWSLDAPAAVEAALATAAPAEPAVAGEDVSTAVEELPAAPAEPAAAGEDETAAPEPPAAASEDASPAVEEATVAPAEPAAASEAVDEATPAEPATASEDVSPAVEEATATPAEPAAASEDVSPTVEEASAARAAPAAASDLSVAVEELKANMTAMSAELAEAELNQASDQSDLAKNIGSVRQELEAVPLDALIANLSRVERAQQALPAEEVRQNLTELSEAVDAIDIQEIKQNFSLMRYESKLIKMLARAHENLRQRLSNLETQDQNAKTVEDLRADLHHVVIQQEMLDRPMEEMTQNISRLEQIQADTLGTVEELHQVVLNHLEDDKQRLLPLESLRQNLSRAEGLQAVDDLQRRLTNLEAQQGKLETLEVPVGRLEQNLSRLEQAVETIQGEVGKQRSVEELRQNLSHAEEQLNSQAEQLAVDSGTEKLRKRLQSELLGELEVAQKNISYMQDELVTANLKLKIAEQHAGDAEAQAAASEKRAEKAEEAAEQAEKTSMLIADRLQAQLLKVSESDRQLRFGHVDKKVREDVGGDNATQILTQPLAQASVAAAGSNATAILAQPNVTASAVESAASTAESMASSAEIIPQAKTIKTCEAWPSNGTYGCSQGQHRWTKLAAHSDEDKCRELCGEQVSSWGNLCCLLSRSGCWVKPNSTAFEYARGAGKGISCKEEKVQMTPPLTMP